MKAPNRPPMAFKCSCGKELELKKERFHIFKDHFYSNWHTMCRCGRRYTHPGNLPEPRGSENG